VEQGPQSRAKAGIEAARCLDDFEAGYGPRVVNGIWRCSIWRLTASCQPAISSPCKSKMSATIACIGVLRTPKELRSGVAKRPQGGCAAGPRWFYSELATGRLGTPPLDSRVGVFRFRADRVILIRPDPPFDLSQGTGVQGEVLHSFLEWNTCWQRLADLPTAALIRPSDLRAETSVARKFAPNQAILVQSPFVTIMPRQFAAAVWAPTLSNADENSRVR
jgi:hypothetical protein